MKKFTQVSMISLLSVGTLFLVYAQMPVAAKSTSNVSRHVAASQGQCSLPTPTSSDPWYGTAGNVLISDRGQKPGAPLHCIWIGFNSSSSYQHFLTLQASMPNGYWIGSRVVVDASAPLGFYFNPAYTLAAQITAENQQTTLAFIQSNPSYYGVVWAGFNWYIVSIVEQV